MLNLVSMTDESIRKKFIQTNIRFIGLNVYAQMELCTIWIKILKRNNLLQLDAFISVGIIQYNINTTKTRVCIAINDMY